MANSVGLDQSQLGLHCFAQIYLYQYFEPLNLKYIFSVQVLYNIALVEIHEDDKPAAEDTLHQALHDADVGQRQLIQQALDLMEVNGLF